MGLKIYRHIINKTTMVSGGSISRFNLDIRKLNKLHPKGGGLIKKNTNEFIEIKWEN